MWQLNNKSIIISLMLVLVIVCGCARQKPKQVTVLPPQILPEPLKEKPVTPRYIYQNIHSRDPFIPLIVESGQANQVQKGSSIPDVDITELSLIGVVWDKKDSIALARGPGGYTLILRYGMLFYGDSPIKGVRGKIVNNKCISLSQLDKVVTMGFKASDTKVMVKGMDLTPKQEELSKEEKQEMMKAFASGFGEGLAKEAVAQQGKQQK
ncbi:hypothetical protein HY793_01475 [Candidatus Desantisbacteria bacterium]|nr:hypothetical protein [Candidatus Desantisbacteria bacterium]